MHRHLFLYLSHLHKTLQLYAREMYYKPSEFFKYDFNTAPERFL